MPEVNLEQTTTPKPSSSLKAILVALGIFALVGVPAYAGFWLGKQQVPPPAPTPKVTTPPVTEVPEATPPAKTDETAGWETHTITQFNLEFKYPPKWSLDCREPDVENWVSAIFCQLTAPGTKLDHGQLDSGAYISVGADKQNANYSTLKGAVEFYVKQDKYSPSERRINNIDGHELASDNHAMFIFENGDYFPWVSWIPLAIDNPLRGDLDNILSTFKFLD